MSDLDQEITLNLILSKDFWTIIQKCSSVKPPEAKVKSKGRTVKPVWSKIKKYRSLDSAVKYGYLGLIKHKPKLTCNLNDFYLKAAKLNRIDMIKYVSGKKQARLWIEEITKDDSKTGHQILEKAIIHNSIDTVRFLHAKGFKLDTEDLMDKLVLTNPYECIRIEFSRKIVDFLVENYPDIASYVVRRLVNGEKDKEYLETLDEKLIMDSMGDVNYVYISNLAFAKLRHAHTPFDKIYFWVSLKDAIHQDNLEMIEWYQEIGYRITNASNDRLRSLAALCATALLDINSRVGSWLLKNTKGRFTDFIRNRCVTYIRPEDIQAFVKNPAYESTDIVKRLKLLVDMGLEFTDTTDAVLDTPSISVCNYLLSSPHEHAVSFSRLAWEGRYSKINSFIFRYILHNNSLSFARCGYSSLLDTSVIKINSFILFCDSVAELFTNNNVKKTWSFAVWWYRNRLTKFMKKIKYPKISEVESTIEAVSREIATVKKRLTKEQLINCHKLLYPTMFRMLENREGYRIDLTTYLIKDVIERSLDDMIDFYISYGVVDYNYIIIDAMDNESQHIFNTVCKLKPDIKLYVRGYVQGLQDGQRRSNRRDRIISFADEHL